MSRKKAEIQPIRAERLKLMINDLKITQTKFADEIGVTQQNISKIMKLKHALTEELARDIIKHYPQYELQWLLGYSDAMTHADLFRNTLAKSDDEQTLLHQMLLSFAKVFGYHIEFNNMESAQNIESIFDMIHKNYCTISRADKKKTFSITELNDFENEICDFIDVRLSHMMK